MSKSKRRDAIDLFVVIVTASILGVIAAGWMAGIVHLGV